jgi:uncharacterized protein YktA (UPF0223 family)
MGRTIPTFRELLEIEKLEWATFKKLLPSKNDKQAFEMVFENACLYTSYLGNASNPIVLESVIMGSIFHNYKQLLQVGKEEDKIQEDFLKKELISLINNKPEGKILFYRVSKKWHGFLYSLHKEDRELLLKMILEICRYDETVSKTINVEDYQSSIDCYFFLLAITQQQKLIDRLNKKPENVETTSATTNRTLSDFI